MNGHVPDFGVPCTEKDLPPGGKPSRVWGTAAQLPSQHYMPFSWGARSCPGQRLGVQQARVIQALDPDA